MSEDRDPVKAFEALFAAHYSGVHAYVIRRVPLAHAEDVLAETFLVAWRRRAEVPQDALPWLLGVARRVVANQLRSDRRRGALAGRLRAASPGASFPWEPLSTMDTELAEALASLSEREREALLLVAWDGLDGVRAARAAGCSAAAFRVRLHRARTRVAAQLRQSTISSSFTSAREETR